MINCYAINHYVINRSDFTEGLIATRLIRRIDHEVIDLKDFTEGLIME